MPEWPSLVCSSPDGRCSRSGRRRRGGSGGCGSGGKGGGEGGWRGGGRRRRRRRWTPASGLSNCACGPAPMYILGAGDMSEHPPDSVSEQIIFESAEPLQRRRSVHYATAIDLPASLQTKTVKDERDALVLRRGLADKFYHQQGPLKVLLVFPKDDAMVAALRGATGQLGYECSLARNASSCADAFQSRGHDLVIVDNRDPKSFDGEAVGKSLRNVKGSQYSVFVALVKRSETEKQDSSVLPYINAGYDRWMVETTTLAAVVSDLLQMDTSEVQPRRQLWAYHSFLLMVERSRELCIVTDLSHHIVYANRAVERAVGSSAKELYGRYVYDLVHVDSRERLLNAAVKGHEWEGVATVAPRRNSETMMLQCRVMPNGIGGRAPANLVFMLEPPPKRGSEAGMSGRGSVPSVRRGSADMRSVCSDGRSIWELCCRCLCCRAERDRLRKGQRPDFDEHERDSDESQEPSAFKPSISAESGDSLRRQSVSKLNSLSMEAPITKVVSLISQAQEHSSVEVSLMLDKVVDILRTTELYSPVVREDRIRPDDPVTSDLISALLQAGSSMPLPTTRRSSNDSAVARGIPVPRSSRSLTTVTTQLSTLLETSLLWEFDVFKLEEISGQRPLLHLGMNLMEHFEVPQTLNVDMKTVHNWLSIIEMNYRATNTYHNSSHAADVMQSSAAFLERERLQRIMDPLDNACCLIAAAVHDVDHPGRSSAFLCNSDHELAILYNDICVLESHHAALAFRITVSDERVNIFKGLDRDVYKLVRLSIIDMVLATEMTKHFEHLAKFVNVFSKPVRDDDESTMNRSRRSLLQMGSDVEATAMSPENIALAKRMLIKCADVSNPARPLRMCVEWALRIAEEYFQQTDEEKDKQLPVVMPMFDRATCSIPKSQIGFMDFIINDMFEAWEAFLGMQQLKFYMEYNYLYWRELEFANIQRIDVERMDTMIDRLGWYESYEPPPLSETNLPFLTSLAKDGQYNSFVDRHLERVSRSSRILNMSKTYDDFAKYFKISFPRRSINLRKLKRGLSFSAGRHSSVRVSNPPTPKNASRRSSAEEASKECDQPGIVQNTKTINTKDIPVAEKGGKQYKCSAENDMRSGMNDGPNESSGEQLGKQNEMRGTASDEPKKKQRKKRGDKLVDKFSDKQSTEDIPKENDKRDNPSGINQRNKLSVDRVSKQKCEPGGSNCDTTDDELCSESNEKCSTESVGKQDDKFAYRVPGQSSGKQNTKINKKHIVNKNVKPKEEQNLVDDKHSDKQDDMHATENFKQDGTSTGKLGNERTMPGRSHNAERDPKPGGKSDRANRNPKSSGRQRSRPCTDDPTKLPNCHFRCKVCRCRSLHNRKYKLRLCAKRSRAVETSRSRGSDEGTKRKGISDKKR